VYRKLRIWLTSASILEAILWPFMIQTWILVPPSAKTAGNRIILLLLVKFKNWSTLSIMVHTRVNITDILYSITKWISKLTHPNLKQNKRNYAHTLLNVLSIKMIIKPTPIFVLSRSIALIENSTQRSIRKSRITGTNQFTELWVIFKHNYKRNQNIFLKYS